MNALTFAERYAQARLYAAQVRTRRMLGDRYAHSKINHVTRRKLVNANVEAEPSLA
jgi:hypothetical protein